MSDAFAFLTRLPVRHGAERPLDLVAAAPWFPVVGAAVGAATGGVHALARLAVPPAPATLLALAFAVLATGGLHEDGLADVADAVGAHTSAERRREILHDPRLGTFGTLAIV